MTMHQGKNSSWLTIRPVYWQRWVTTLHITHSYVYPLYLMGEDAILAILCMDLLINTTTAGEWSNNLIFDDNIS